MDVVERLLIETIRHADKLALIYAEKQLGSWFNGEKFVFLPIDIDVEKEMENSAKMCYLFVRKMMTERKSFLNDEEPEDET